jgi:hypothetical protein
MVCPYMRKDGFESGSAEQPGSLLAFYECKV